MEQGVFVNTERLKQELVHSLIGGPKSWSKLVAAMNLSVYSTSSSQCLPTLSDDIALSLIKSVANPQQGKGDSKLLFALKDEYYGQCGCVCALFTFPGC